jgi:hypothetical protein
MFDIKGLADECEKEVQAERLEAAKRRVKTKLREREQAKAILANIDRELEDIYAAISQGN